MSKSQPQGRRRSLGAIVMLVAGLFAGAGACDEEHEACPPIPSLDPGQFRLSLPSQGTPLFVGFERGELRAAEDEVVIEYERSDGTIATVTYNIVDRFPD